MGAHAMGPAMVDRADVEVARFDVAEAAFGVAEGIVKANEYRSFSAWNLAERVGDF